MPTQELGCLNYVGCRHPTDSRRPFSGVLGRLSVKLVESDRVRIDVALINKVSLYQLVDKSVHQRKVGPETRSQVD